MNMHESEQQPSPEFTQRDIAKLYEAATTLLFEPPTDRIVNYSYDRKTTPGTPELSGRSTLVEQSDSDTLQTSAYTILDVRLHDARTESQMHMGGDGMPEAFNLVEHPEIITMFLMTDGEDQPGVLITINKESGGYTHTAELLDQYSSEQLSNASEAISLIQSVISEASIDD